MLHSWRNQVSTGPEHMNEKRMETWEAVCGGGLALGTFLGQPYHSLAWSQLLSTLLVHPVYIVLCSSLFFSCSYFTDYSFIGAFIHNFRNFCWNRTWMFVVGDFSQEGLQPLYFFLSSVLCWNWRANCHMSLSGWCVRKSLRVWVPFCPILPNSEGWWMSLRQEQSVTCVLPAGVAVASASALHTEMILCVIAERPRDTEWAWD